MPLNKETKPNQRHRLTSPDKKKEELMCFKQDGTISNLCGKPLKLVDQYTYLGYNISSTENHVNIRIGKAWIAIDRLSDLSDIIKRDFCQVVVV